MTDKESMNKVLHCLIAVDNAVDAFADTVTAFNNLLTAFQTGLRETRDSLDMPEPPAALPAEPEEAKQPEAIREKTTEQVLKMEDVRAILAKQSRAGHTAEVKDLLKQFGADRLSAVDPSAYSALAEAAGRLGA